MDPIILASGSLRRQEYFRILGLPFSIIPPQIDEDPGEITNPQELAEDLAIRKVKKILEFLKGRNPPWICGADTLIAVDGKVFGKPKDRDDAERMLQTLQGREHQVITALALYSGKANTIDCRSVASDVIFAPLDAAQLEWYLETGEWQGVAGAYRIQGLGACLISGIRGSYSSIVGLPMHEFYAMLHDNGYLYGD
ncbi:MAG: Maf family protein [Treponema sp.]|jgi:septum formation protein|nr:Maf family protein [Treponema sp.]